MMMEAWLVIIIATGFMVEGLRIANNGFEFGSFVGNLVGSWLSVIQGKLTLNY